MSYLSFGSGMEASAKARELSDSQAQASTRAQEAVKGNQPNIPGQRDAAAKFQQAKLEMAKANVQRKVAEADIGFKTIRAAVTFAGGAVAGVVAANGDKKTDLSRAKATAANQDVAKHRLDNVHGKKLDELLNFQGRLQEAESQLVGHRQALAKFDDENSGELSPQQANQRAALRRSVQDAEQRVGELQALSVFRPDNDNRLAMGDQRDDIVDGYLKQQGMAQAARLLDSETREKLRTQLMQVRQDNATKNQGGRAEAVIKAEEQVGNLQSQKAKVETELQAAHQSGDAHRIQRAERQLKVIDGQLDKAKATSNEALRDFRQHEERDAGFWERAVGKAITPFMQDLVGQLMGDSRGGGLMAAAQAYAEAVRAMSNATAAAGRAAAEAEKLGVDLE